MQSVAEMLQRNPSLVLVLLVGLPSLPWAAAYARRPSRRRRLIAAVPLLLMAGVTVIASVEASAHGAPWWPPLALAAAITAVWALLFVVARRQ